MVKARTRVQKWADRINKLEEENEALKRLQERDLGRIIGLQANLKTVQQERDEARTFQTYNYDRLCQASEDLNNARAEIDKLRAEVKRLTPFQPFKVVCLEGTKERPPMRGARACDSLVRGRIYTVLSVEEPYKGYVLEGVYNANPSGWDENRFLTVIE